MAATPSVVFVSCTGESPRNVVRSLIGENEAIQFEEVEPGVAVHPWHISNKYYEVDIQLCAMENKSLSSESFASTVEAIVIYFDSDTPSALAAVNGWYSFLKEYEADVKILLCSKCNDTSRYGISRRKVQEWCVQEGFELVEMKPSVDEEWEAEQDFVETTGPKRIWQALEAHVWPNLKIKERREPTTMAALLHGGMCKSTGCYHDSSNSSARDNNEVDNVESNTDFWEGNAENNEQATPKMRSGVRLDYNYRFNK